MSSWLPLHVAPELPIYLNWSDVYGCRVPTLRDGTGKLIYPLNEYLDQVVNERADRDTSETSNRSAVNAATYALKSLAEYFGAEQIAFSLLDDKTLKAYRASELKRVLARASSKSDEKTAKRTVNAKLRDIYRFAFESQKLFRLPSQTIGSSGAKIRSSLPDFEENPNRLNREDKRTHPLCYRRAGENSMADGGQYWASDEDIVQVEEVFNKSRSPVVVRRNKVLLRVIEQTGFRAGSTASLLTSQFSDEALAKQASLDAFVVTPPNQKLSLSVPFPIRWELAFEIARYINDDAQRDGRIELMKRLGVSERQSRGRIFLSATRGTPLEAHTIVEIFADAVKIGGAPKGAGAHGLRRRMGETCADEIIETRIAEGLSTAREDVEEDIRRVLGHGTVEAQRAYRRTMSRRRRKSLVEELNKKVLQEQLARDATNSQLKASQERVRALEKTVSQLKKVSRPRTRKDVAKSLG